MADKTLSELPGRSSPQNADLFYLVGGGADYRISLTQLASALRGIDIEFVAFDKTAGAPSHSEGRIFWDSDDKTVAVMPDISGVVLQVGQESWVRARNDTGSTIGNGKVVYVSGAASSRPQITKAAATSIAQAESVLGITTHSIDDGDEGFVTTFGLVRDLDTSGFSPGDTLYLDTVAGEFTDTAPVPPNQAVKVGIVLVVDASDGVILFRHFQAPGADYAGISFDDNAVEKSIEWQKVYHLIDEWTTNNPYTTSTPDQANNRITIGQSRDYDVALSTHAESAGLNKTFEIRLFQVSPTTVAVTNITQANPGVVTAAGHGLSNGDFVKITGVVGMTEVNDKIFKVANAAGATFELNDSEGSNVSTAGAGAYTSGGTVAEAFDTLVHTKNEYGQRLDDCAAGPHPTRLNAGNYLEGYIENYTDTTNTTIEGGLMSLRVLSQS